MQLVDGKEKNEAWIIVKSDLEEDKKKTFDDSTKKDTKATALQKKMKNEKVYDEKISN